jgi:hypothetical protein
MNWPFVHADAGGDRAAAIYGVLESAKRIELDPEPYLRHVLSRIADHPHLLAAAVQRGCRARRQGIGGGRPSTNAVVAGRSARSR